MHSMQIQDCLLSRRTYYEVIHSAARELEHELEELEELDSPDNDNNRGALVMDNNAHDEPDFFRDLRRFIHRHKIKQGTLAKCWGVSQPSVSQYLKGNRPSLTEEDWYHLLDTLAPDRATGKEAIAEEADRRYKESKKNPHTAGQYSDISSLEDIVKSHYEAELQDLKDALKEDTAIDEDGTIVNIPVPVREPSYIKKNYDGLMEKVSHTYDENRHHASRAKSNAACEMLREMSTQIKLTVIDLIDKSPEEASVLISRVGILVSSIILREKSSRQKVIFVNVPEGSLLFTESLSEFINDERVHIIATTDSFASIKPDELLE